MGSEMCIRDSIGPAAWKYNWSRDNYDALAGALAAGHIIECELRQQEEITPFFMKYPLSLTLAIQ